MFEPTICIRTDNENSLVDEVWLERRDYDRSAPQRWDINSEYSLWVAVSGPKPQLCAEWLTFVAGKLQGIMWRDEKQVTRMQSDYWRDDEFDISIVIHDVKEQDNDEI